MEEFDITAVARKSVKGVFALASRTFLVTVFSSVTQLILAGIIGPASFGVFYLVSAMVIVLTYFQDIGLAASLIQKKEHPTTEELRTIFTVQQMLVLAITIPGIIFSGFIASFYHLNSEGMYLLYALLFSLVMSSLKTIPTVMLERNLNFDKLVIPQILENVVYNSALLFFAIQGFGVTSFTYSILIREVVGLIAIYYIQPWPIGVAWHRGSLKTLVSFGAPFQANSILALIKDNLLTLYLGRVLSLTEIGYIGFAQKLSFLPLRLIMDHVIRITFPSYSRLQHDRVALAKLVEKSLFIIAFLIFPIVSALSLFSSDIIRYMPFGNYAQKWDTTYLWLPIVFFSLNALFASVTVPLTNFLNAIGKVGTTLRIMLFLTIATWILTPLGITLFGYTGVAAASFLVAASAIGVVWFVKKHIPFSFIRPIYASAVAAGGMVTFVYFTHGIVASFASLLGEMIVSGIVYLCIVLLFDKKNLVSTTQFVLVSIRHK